MIITGCVDKQKLIDPVFHNRVAVEFIISLCCRFLHGIICFGDLTVVMNLFITF